MNSFFSEVDPLAFQPKVHPAVTVGLKAVCLLYTKFFGQSSVLMSLSQTFYIIVVTALPDTPKNRHIADTGYSA